MSTITTTLPDDLPTVVRLRNGTMIRPQDDLAGFLGSDLDISRLERMVDHWLWVAGRLGSIRPLHQQIVLGRCVVITEHLDLHLLWKRGILYLKPLPSYLLDDLFIKEHLSGNVALVRASNGFLWSYARLINHRSDFCIAKAMNLVPADMQWKDWKVLADSKLSNMVVQHQMGKLDCSPRFWFGELRLSRVNFIYRYHPMYRFQHLVRGYHTQSDTFKDFLQRNFAWLIAVFAYITIVLTAMQVGLATQELQLDEAFNRASYGFTVFRSCCRLPRLSL